MFPMRGMRRRESESEGGRDLGWQQGSGVGLEKQGVAIHGMSEAEGGTGHCANPNRPERLRGLWRRTACARLWSSGETAA